MIEQIFDGIYTVLCSTVWCKRRMLAVSCRYNKLACLHGLQSPRPRAPQLPQSWSELKLIIVSSFRWGFFFLLFLCRDCNWKQKNRQRHWKSTDSRKFYDRCLLFFPLSTPSTVPVFPHALLVKLSTLSSRFMCLVFKCFENSFMSVIIIACFFLVSERV